jgi:hypothetical protein
VVVIHSKPTKKIGSHFFPFSSALPLASPLLPLLPATQNQKSKPPSPQSSVRGPQPPPVCSLRGSTGSMLAPARAPLGERL